MTSNFNLLTDKVAIVTGCNRGIGKAILDVFLQNGAAVYAVARKEGCFQNHPANDKLFPCYMDVTNKDAVKNLFLKVKKESGKLDVLVNNAGVMLDAPLGMITESQIQTTFSVNVFAIISFMQYAAKLMVRSKFGSIINLASIMGISGNINQIAYSASKGAVIALTKSAAKELAPNNIRVNAIAPGMIKTDIMSNAPEDRLEQLKSKIAMGKIGSPEEIAKAALFLASDLSEYISGQILGVDGMMSN